MVHRYRFSSQPIAQGDKFRRRKQGGDADG
jgi:hypothetical protein